MNQIAKAPGPFNYVCITDDWHRLDSPMGTYFGYSRDEVFGKHDTDVLNAFEKQGQAAAFLLGSGRPAAAFSAEKRITTAIALYNDHPHLQDRMHDISLGFTGWNLTARLEQQAALAQSDNQRGMRA